MSRPGGVNLPDNFNKDDPVYSKFVHNIPTRDNCNLDDPKQMFVWMFVALPGVNGGYQIMPSSYNMLISEHIYDCGAMLKCPSCGHMKDPAKVWIPPAANDPHWLTSPGRWVKPKDVPKDMVDPIDDALNKLTTQQHAALLKRLKEREKGE